MKTYVYINKAGEKYSVVHRSSSSKIWEHKYGADCLACKGKSEVAPLFPGDRAKGE